MSLVKVGRYLIGAATRTSRYWHCSATPSGNSLPPGTCSHHDCSTSGLLTASVSRSRLSSDRHVPSFAECCAEPRSPAQPTCFPANPYRRDCTRARQENGTRTDPHVCSQCSWRSDLAGIAGASWANGHSAESRNLGRTVLPRCSRESGAGGQNGSGHRIPEARSEVLAGGISSGRLDSTSAGNYQ